MHAESLWPGPRGGSKKDGLPLREGATYEPGESAPCCSSPGSSILLLICGCDITVCKCQGAFPRSLYHRDAPHLTQNEQALFRILTQTRSLSRRPVHRAAGPHHPQQAGVSLYEKNKLFLEWNGWLVDVRWWWTWFLNSVSLLNRWCLSVTALFLSPLSLLSSSYAQCQWVLDQVKVLKVWRIIFERMWALHLGCSLDIKLEDIDGTNTGLAKDPGEFVVQRSNWVWVCGRVGVRGIGGGAGGMQSGKVLNFL